MPDQQKPNVLVFFTDQQRADTSGLHGCPLELTPNLDRLAGKGTHLAHTFSCQPVCGPARSLLQTGLYPTRTGCYRNGIPLPPDAKTLAHHFSAGGYDTAYIGKWHLGSADPVPAQEQGGYDYWLAANALEHVSDPYHTVLFDNEGTAHEFPGYRVDAMADAAIRYIDNRDDEQPFFLFLSFLEPHHQNRVDDYPPPPGYRERYTGRWMPPDLAALGGSAHRHVGGYYGMVKRLDEALGRIMDALTSLGLADDTIVLFTSDHGCHFRTRNAEYKRSCHDASIHVPGVFWGPGFDGGGRVDHLISLIDLPPTLLDAAGLPVPDEMDGKSLLPLLQDRQAPWQDDVFIQISESGVGRALRTRRWKYSVSAHDADGWRDAGAKEYEEKYLYDLEADPHELHNLVGFRSHQEVARVLRQRLCQRMQEAGEAEPRIIPAPTVESGQFVVYDDEVRL